MQTNITNAQTGIQKKKAPWWLVVFAVLVVLSGLSSLLVGIGQLSTNALVGVVDLVIGAASIGVGFGIMRLNFMSAKVYAGIVALSIVFQMFGRISGNTKQPWVGIILVWLFQIAIAVSLYRYLQKNHNS